VKAVYVNPLNEAIKTQGFAGEPVCAYYPAEGIDEK
jgi:hypothetical protein